MKRYIIRAVGKSKESWQKEAISEYIRRLGAFTKIEIVEIAEGHGGAQKADEKKTKKNEAIALLKSIPKNGFFIALDKTGANFSSIELAKKLEKETESGMPIIIFIGGSWGLAEEVRKHADLVLSFGKETLPHILARILLLEQLYRAETILRNKTYHK